MSNITTPDIEEYIQAETEIATEVDNEGQVIVHCSFKNEEMDYQGVRIWKSTVLIDENSEHESELLHAEGITMFPDWTWIKPGTTKRFTLIFSRLPKSCAVFHFYERIPQTGGFMVADIARNQSDVYQIEL